MKTRLCKRMFAKAIALSLAACLAFPGTAFASSEEGGIENPERTIQTSDGIAPPEADPNTLGVADAPLSEEAAAGSLSSEETGTKNGGEDAPAPEVPAPSETAGEKDPLKEAITPDAPSEVQDSLQDTEPLPEEVPETDNDDQNPEAADDDQNPETDNDDQGAAAQPADGTTFEAEGQTSSPEAPKEESTSLENEDPAPDAPEKDSATFEATDLSSSSETPQADPDTPTEETGDLSLTPNANDPAPCTLTLDINGGSWVNPDDQMISQFITGLAGHTGDTYYLPNEYDVKRTGYQFLGWTTTKDGTTYVNSESYALTGDTTLYAKWKKLIGLKLNLNGGSWSDDYARETFENGYYDEKDASVYLPSDYSVVRNGYRFKGWTLKKNEGTALTGEYKLTKDVTLYALWQKTYLAKLNLNGGQWADGYGYEKERWENGYTGDKGEILYLPWPNSLTRKGYLLVGWTIGKDGDLIDNYEHELTKNVTFYAKWAKSYCVTLDLNNGKWVSGDNYYREEFENGYYVTKNTEVYLPYSQYVTRKGYYLKGWTLEKNKGKIYNSYKVTKDTTLYARWVKAVTVTLDAGKGYFDSDKSNHKKTFQEEKGAAVGNSLLYSHIPKNGNKIFGGWYKDAKLTKPLKRSDPLSKNVTFYAKWITKTYKITVTNLKGASYNNRATDEYISGDESKANSYSFYITQGDQIGYLYAWKDSMDATFYLDKACKSQPLYSEYVPTKDTTIYAKFGTDITISWDANGGKTDSDTTSGWSTTTKGLMWESRPSVYRDGYYLVGWYDVKNPSVILPASHVFTKNTSVKAKWKKAIKVVLDPKGGKWYAVGDSKEKITFYMKAKSRLGDVEDYLPTPVKDGYIFEGWKSSLTNKKVKNLAADKPAKDVTYTAIWTKVKEVVKVTLVGGDGSIYDPDTDTYVSKKDVAVPKNLKLSEVDLLYIIHDESSKNLSCVGWSLKKNGTALKDSYKFTKDVTLYPVWKKVTSLHVALVTNGGSLDNIPSNEPWVYYVTKGDTLSLPTASNMEREGYTFVAWYTDYKCTKKVSNPNKYKPTKSGYLYAKWKKK